jgi:hypothetical protein
MATIFHLLNQGRPMVEYEAIRSLLQFLETPKLAKNHWSDNMGWQLAEHMER